MRYLILLLILAVAAFAWVDENGSDSSFPEGTVPADGAAITLTVLDTFQVSSANNMLGLDTQDGSNQLVLMDNTGGSIRAVVMGTGNPVWDFPVYNAFQFGTCHNWPPSYGWYANNFLDSNMYYNAGSWGVAFANPAGSAGRGMDFQNDASMIWETYSSSGVHRIYRIDESGGSTSYTITEPTDQMSGLTVFPYNGNLGIFVTVYGFQDWFLYEFDGSNMTYIGSGNAGLSNFTSSYGLTYHPDTDTFFWSYVVYGSNKWIAEVQFTESSLEQSSWGSIKAQF